jgi:hypothetical protein
VFTGSYWPASYFAPTYWPGVGGGTRAWLAAGDLVFVTNFGNTIYPLLDYTVVTVYPAPDWTVETAYPER